MKEVITMSIRGETSPRNGSVTTASQHALSGVPDAELYALRPEVPTRKSKGRIERGNDSRESSENSKKRHVLPPVFPKSKGAKQTLKNVQNAIHYTAMMEDGICEIYPGLYSATIAMADSDYRLLSDEGKKKKFAGFCGLLNGTDTNTSLQINVISHPITEQDFENSYAFDLPASAALEGHRKEFNAILKDKCLPGHGGGIIADKLLTITIKAPNLETAKHQLTQQVEQYAKSLQGISGSCNQLNGSQRLAFFKHMLRPDDHTPISYPLMALQKLRSKDLIAPSSFDFKDVEAPDNSGIYRKSPSIFRTGTSYGQVLTLHGDGYGADTSDQFVHAITSLPFRTTISIFITPINQTWMIEKVRATMGDMDTVKTNKIRSAAKEGVPAFLATPVAFEEVYKKVDKLHTNLTEDNQKYFSVTVLVGTFADTPEDVLDQADQIRSAVEQFSFHLESVDYEGENALNSLLPIGQNFTPFDRGLNTACTAMFIPFTSPELIHDKGLWLGVNEQSKNPIYINPDLLNNGNGMILGTSGSGKSMTVKMLLLMIRLRYPDDEIIILDPESEYGNWTEQLGGEVIQISPGKGNYINPFDINANYGTDNTDALYRKVGFIISLVNAALKYGISDEERSIVDRAARAVYHNYFNAIKWGKAAKIPTFVEFSKILDLYQDGYIRPMAQRIRTKLEIFTEGSMNIFAHETNVDIHNSIIDIDLRDLTDEHRKMGMATTLDLIWNRLTLNQSQNKRTWIFVEEYQSLMTDRYTSEFFRSVWSRARKYGGRPFAITQNVDLLLKSDDSSTMIANSEFVIALNQSGKDVYQMQNLLRLSNDQTEYLENALPGHGLIRYGNSMIPFNAEFPSDSEIYKLITTKPGEMLQYTG